MNETQFDQWCIMDLFGHQKIAGRVSEQVIGGQSFVRVDVPEVNGQPAFTRLYGSGAIYSITPVSEEIARSAVAAMRVEPVAVYYLPAPAAESKMPVSPALDDDDDDFDDDQENTF